MVSLPHLTYSLLCRTCVLDRVLAVSVCASWTNCLLRPSLMTAGSLAAYLPPAVSVLRVGADVDTRASPSAVWTLLRGILPGF